MLKVITVAVRYRADLGGHGYVTARFRTRWRRSRSRRHWRSCRRRDHRLADQSRLLQWRAGLTTSRAINPSTATAAWNGSGLSTSTAATIRGAFVFATDH